MAWTLARALDEDLSALISRAESMSSTRGAALALSVQQILNSPDEAIAAVRTWLRTRYPDAAGMTTQLRLSDSLSKGGVIAS